jgi:hypothetical protein
MCGFADPFQAALDGITRLSVALKRLSIHAEQISADSFGGQGCRRDRA